jgi:hypothetical protein
VNALLVPVPPRGGEREREGEREGGMNEHAVVSAAVESLLGRSRQALFALHSLVAAVMHERGGESDTEGTSFLHDICTYCLGCLFIVALLSLICSLVC